MDSVMFWKSSSAAEAKGGDDLFFGGWNYVN
jgi:hypothetical protein